jgi:hypothetical protein
VLDKRGRFWMYTTNREAVRDAASALERLA